MIYLYEIKNTVSWQQEICPNMSKWMLIRKPPSDLKKYSNAFAAYRSGSPEEILRLYAVDPQNAI